MMEDARIGLHSRLNQTDWFLDGWNVTDDRGTLHDYRVGLSGYTYGCVVAYEVTRNPYWLAEAKWLLDGYMRVQGESWTTYNKSWRLYRHLPFSHYGWLHHDAELFMAMAKMNELGYFYPVVDLIDSAISVARYNNSTDLGWEYYFPQQSGELTNYIVNTFVPIMVPMAYLTRTNVRNYTYELERIYHASERFRIGDAYRYNLLDTAISPEYSLATIASLLCARKYTPNIFNDTQLQRSINYFGYVYFRPRYFLYMAVRIGVPAYAQEFILPDGYLRGIRMKYDLMLNQFREFYYQDRYIFFNRYAMEWWSAGSEFLYVLGQFLGTEIPLTQVRIQKVGSLWYSSARVDNGTYLVSSPTYLRFPSWGAWYSEIDQYPSSTTIQGMIYNEASSCFEGTVQYEDSSFVFTCDKYLFDFNITRTSGTSKLPWKIFETIIFSGYSYCLMFTNGTLIQLNAANKTIRAEDTFALEINKGTSSSWLLFKLDNSTLLQQTLSDKMRLATQLSGFQSIYIGLVKVSLDSPSDFQSTREAVRRGLERLQKGINPTVPETIFPKTWENVIHSDSNVTAYQYNAAGKTMLITLSAKTGTNSTTVIYCDKGKPTKVFIDKTTASEGEDWIYDSSAKILTVSTLQKNTLIKIKILWTGHRSGHGSAPPTFGCAPE